jgi:hypothetical protein
MSGGSAAPAHNDERAKKRLRRATFPQFLLMVTVATHLGLVPAYGEALTRAGAPQPYLLGAALAGLLVLPMRGRLQSIIADAPRPAWRLSLVDEPYYAHWCATFFAAPIAVLASVGTLLFDLAQGRPLHLPGTFALGVYLTLLAMGFYSIKIRRRWVAVRQLTIPVVGLPASFEGFRVSQLSDLHIGGMLPRGLGERWVALSNAAKADLVAVTGDLVTSGENFHDQIASLLAGLTARERVVVSMGNHDYFGEGDPLVNKLRDAGLTVLRNESILLERGGEKLRISAVDDTWTARADLDRTLAGPKPAPTVLLAHDPSLFDRAAELGADLVLSGHTHAGQLAMPFMVKHLNLARVAYRYTYGIYRRGTSTLYVHAGMGTTGPPARFGAAPELVIFTLTRAPS